MTLDRRAAAKTTAARKPTTTKAAAPKTTKARPTKATKTGKPAKASKGSPKPSKTTKAAGTAKPSACPVKKPAKKPRAVTSRAYDYIVHLFARDNEEFIGWHGTNSDMAALWAKKGYLKKPTGPLDYIPWKKEGTGKGTSGANAELGPGLYLADDRGALRFPTSTWGRTRKRSPCCAPSSPSHLGTGGIPSTRRSSPRTSLAIRRTSRRHAWSTSRRLCQAWLAIPWSGSHSWTAISYHHPGKC